MFGGTAGRDIAGEKVNVHTKIEANISLQQVLISAGKKSTNNFRCYIQMYVDSGSTFSGKSMFECHENKISLQNLKLVYKIKHRI